MTAIRRRTGDDDLAVFGRALGQTMACALCGALALAALGSGPADGRELALRAYLMAVTAAGFVVLAVGCRPPHGRRLFVSPISATVAIFFLLVPLAALAL